MPTHQNYKRFIGIEEINKVAATAKRSQKFREAWDKGDVYLAFNYAEKFVPDMDFSTFDDVSEYRTLFHKDFSIACSEFAHILAGVE